MNWTSANKAYSQATRTLKQGDEIVMVTMSDGTVVVVADGELGKELAQTVNHAMNGYDAAAKRGGRLKVANVNDVRSSGLILGPERVVSKDRCGTVRQIENPYPPSPEAADAIARLKEVLCLEDGAG